MDIFSSLTEPSVIISLAFSLFIYLFPEPGKKAGRWLAYNISSKSKRVMIKNKWRIRKNVLSTISNPYEMHWQITRTYSLMLLFAVSIVTFIILVSIGPLKGIGQLPTSVQYFIYSPIMALEILWLNQRENTRSFIKIAGKRITK